MSRTAHKRRSGKRRYLLVDEVGGPLLGFMLRQFLRTTEWAGEIGDPVPPTHRASRDRVSVTQIRRERAYARDALAKLGTAAS